jgi:hypothetical protein
MAGNRQINQAYPSLYDRYVLLHQFCIEFILVKLGVLSGQAAESRSHTSKIGFLRRFNAH